ncbi:hypothetical protein MYX07_06300 [Patescibacteria group bacterium AH-259-L07]|nr:hypothetical protein [Patescibacteria group bacterium AH-259-L07]
MVPLDTMMTSPPPPPPSVVPSAPIALISAPIVTSPLARICTTPPCCVGVSKPGLMVGGMPLEPMVARIAPSLTPGAPWVSGNESRTWPLCGSTVTAAPTVAIPVALTITL